MSMWFKPHVAENGYSPYFTVPPACPLTAPTAPCSAKRDAALHWESMPEENGRDVERGKGLG